MLGHETQLPTPAPDAPRYRHSIPVAEVQNPLLLRGLDTYHHFVSEPRPQKDFDGEAKAMQVAINARRGLDAAGKAAVKTS